MGKRARKKHVPYQSLEPRNLLASISVNGGELILGGGTGNDVASVSSSGNDIIAMITGATTQTFAASDIDAIRFIGLGGDDSFTNGTSIPSFAFGGGGNDTLNGGSGIDTLVGGPGNDVLRGNDGNDTIRGGGEGDNNIEGGNGDDRLFGGLGENEIRGNDGNDTIFGGPVFDLVLGGDGDDLLFPGSGENEVRAGDGDDFIVGGVGVDIVFGDAGEDQIFTQSGDDIIDGGSGNDRIISGVGNDTIVGGTGIEFIRGGAGNDIIDSGSGGNGTGAERNRVFGEAGDDEITGGNNGDFLVGGEGIDTINGGGGNDLIVGAAGNDIINGQAGNDTVLGGDGNDTIEGGDGNDNLFGDDGNDTLRGNAGNDTLLGLVGNDTLEGGTGDDELRGWTGSDNLDGGAGNDRAIFRRNQSVYTIISGNLRVSGDGANDPLAGVERVFYADGSEAVILETITVQPIIASNNNGTNQAEYFGTNSQQAAIESNINAIYYNARINVRWLAPIFWNNTFANVGNGGTRPANDAIEILDQAEDANLIDRDSLTINMFFVEVVPGSPNQSETTTNGLAFDGANGVFFQVGDELPNSEIGQETVARVAAHEIAHNLGLDHVSDPTNLLSFPTITGDNLTTPQSATLIRSEFSR